jgi:hypothetical protein
MKFNIFVTTFIDHENIFQIFLTFVGGAAVHSAIAYIGGGVRGYLAVSNLDGNHSNNTHDCALEEMLNLQVFNEHEDYTDYSVCIYNV